MQVPIHGVWEINEEFVRAFWRCTVVKFPLECINFHLECFLFFCFVFCFVSGLKEFGYLYKTICVICNMYCTPNQAHGMYQLWFSLHVSSYTASVRVVL